MKATKTTIFLSFILSISQAYSAPVKKSSKKYKGRNPNSVTSCRFIKVVKGADGDFIEKELSGGSVEYQYSKSQILKVSHKFNGGDSADREEYSISYKSIPNVEKAEEYSEFKLACDDILTCDGTKHVNYSSYKKDKKLEIDPNGNSVALPYGGRDLFFFERYTNTFQFKFIDIYVDPTEWNGVKIECTY